MVSESAGTDAWLALHDHHRYAAAPRKSVRSEYCKSYSMSRCVAAVATSRTLVMATRKPRKLSRGREGIIVSRDILEAAGCWLAPESLIWNFQDSDNSAEVTTRLHVRSSFGLIFD